MAIRFVDAGPGAAKPERAETSPAPESGPRRRAALEPEGLEAGRPEPAGETDPPDALPAASPEPRPRPRRKAAAAEREAPAPPEPEPEPPSPGASDDAPLLFSDLHVHPRPPKGPTGKPRRNRRGFG